MVSDDLNLLHVHGELVLFQGLWGSSTLSQPPFRNPQKATMKWVITRLLPLDNSNLFLLFPLIPTYKQGIQARDSKWQAGPAPGLALVPARHLLPYGIGYITL